LINVSIHIHPVPTAFHCQLPRNLSMTELRLARPLVVLRLAIAGPVSSSISGRSPAVAIRTRACPSRRSPTRAWLFALTSPSSARGMASLATQTAQNTPFTRAVVQALRSLYILSLPVLPQISAPPGPQPINPTCRADTSTPGTRKRSPTGLGTTSACSWATSTPPPSSIWASRQPMSSRPFSSPTT
jgi:hypothetical protein